MMGTDSDVPRASGALIAKERRVLEGIVGEQTVRKALDRLPTDLREEYESITPLTKIPTDTVERVYEAVADEAGRDVFRMHRDVVRTGVEQALKSIWRVLLRFTGDEALVRRTPLFFSRGLSKGTLEAKMVESGKAEIRLTGWAKVSAMQINGIAAATEAILTCAGRRGVRVESHRTLDGACLIATWE
jgi:hypothetical protein